MTSKIYVVTDLGPGDGGKGGVVHAVCKMTGAHTVIKVGGAQGSHGVRTSAGESFAFSQWGCGTLEGVRTHISPQMVISLEGLLNESEALRYQCGIHDAFGLLTADQRALCATPYHGIVSRLKELARGSNPRGTVGTGVGEAVRYAERSRHLAIRALDLQKPGLEDKLYTIREEAWREVATIGRHGLTPEDAELAEEERSNLNSPEFLDFCIERALEVSKRLRIVSPQFFVKEILAKDGVAVVEKSHGVLTDRVYGFHPHTSALRTLPVFTSEMLREEGFRGQVVNIGVTRAYAIRHGAGPLPTDDPRMYETLLPGSHKQDNRYQGRVRVGPLDSVLLRYAIEVCGGPTAFDGLAITWFDQIETNGSWRICHRYRNVENNDFFAPNGAIKVCGIHASDDEQMSYRELLGRQLKTCVPEVTEHEIPVKGSKDDLYSLCDSVLKVELGVPVRMVSFGPTERDKMCK